MYAAFSYMVFLHYLYTYLRVGLDYLLPAKLNGLHKEQQL